MRKLETRTLIVFTAVVFVLLFTALNVVGFAEEPAELTPLGAPTDVHWDTEIPGRLVFTGAEPTQGKYYMNAYIVTESGREVVFNTLYTGIDKNIERKMDLFLSENIFTQSGDYIFTIQAKGDKKEYSDGDVVESDVFHYVKPDIALEVPVNLRWSWPYAEWDYVEGSEYDQYMRGRFVKYYYAASEDEEPHSVGATSSATLNNHEKIYDNPLRNGEGYYYFKVSIYSNDINTVASSEFSDLSPAYYYTPREVSEELNDILTDAAAGSSPDSIRESVTNIGRQKLHEAMVADNDDTGVVQQLQQLEEATGATMTVDVAEGVNDDFDESLVTVVGALLNPLAQNDVTLNITKPKTNDVIPELYNSAIAVRFGMDLDGLYNTSYLEVPVKITLPIPESINPSFLKILHYPANADPTVALQPQEVLLPNVFEKDGQWYASFVLDHFSDFVMTEEIPEAPVVSDGDGLWVGDLKVTDENRSGDGWAYDPDTITLILNGPSIQTTHNGALIFAKGIDLTISVEGDTVLASDSDDCSVAIGVQSSQIALRQVSANAGGKGGNLTIIVADDAKLTLKARDSGVYAEESLKINGGEIEADGSYAGVYTGNGDIIIEGGTVTATSPNNYGVWANNGNIFIKGGILTAKGSIVGVLSSNGNITIENGTKRVTATGATSAINTPVGTITVGDRLKFSIPSNGTLGNDKHNVYGDQGTFKAGMAEIIPISIPGDVNADGKVDATDRMILARFLAGWEGYDAKIKNMEAADLNGNKEVDAADRMILARYLAGWTGYDQYFK